MARHETHNANIKGTQKRLSDDENKSFWLCGYLKLKFVFFGTR